MQPESALLSRRPMLQETAIARAFKWKISSLQCYALSMLACVRAALFSVKSIAIPVAARTL